MRTRGGIYVWIENLREDGNASTRESRKEGIRDSKGE